MDTLKLKKATRIGSPNKQERHYLDFLISGQSLLDILKYKNSDLITPLGWSDNEDFEQQIIKVFTFRKKSDLKNGRIMFYVCPECGDIGCGAITSEIRNLSDRIVWKDFRYETNLEEDMKMLPDIELLEFDKQNYFNAFKI